MTTRVLTCAARCGLPQAPLRWSFPTFLHARATVEVESYAIDNAAFWVMATRVRRPTPAHSFVRCYSRVCGRLYHLTSLVSEASAVL